MAYNPHKKQAEAHRAFLVDGFKRGTIFWGRRVGKSSWSRWHMIIAALLKQGPYWVVFDTREHAQEVMWDALLAEIPKGLIAKTDGTKLVITFNYVSGTIKLPGLGAVDIQHDPAKLPSTITLTGSDTADRDRGNEAQGILFDEYQDQSPGTWRRVYEPFLATTQGWACFMGTAKGYNHWWKMMERAKKNAGWFYSKATWRDVTDHIVEGRPMISKEWIAESRKEAKESNELDDWLQEYELAFNNPQKSVYQEFNRDIHVIEPTDPRIPRQENATVYGVWDFGYAEGHPMAFNLVFIDNQGRWFVTTETGGTGVSMDEFIERIRTRLKLLEQPEKISGIIADSARPDLIDYARSKGLPVIPAPKKQGSVQAGISLLAQKIHPKTTMMGQLEPNFFISDECPETIFQFEKYEYPEAKEERPLNDNPLKIHDDHPDALRYLALYLKYGVAKRQDKLGSGVKTNAYGIPV